MLEPVIVSPDSADIAYGAGFLEGEGYFGRNKTTCSVEATQKVPEPLIYLQQMWGGSLGQIHNQGFDKQSTYWRWRVSGRKAMTCANDVFPWMSPRRKEQINKAFELGEAP